jgi:hypothetical protein
MRTRDKLICECGHTGNLVLSENDTPYSQNWESYSLEGFTGSARQCSDMPKNALLPLTCDKCKTHGKVRYA